MAAYFRNRGCHCVRCQARSFTGAAVLVTVGVLLLLDNYHIFSFNDSWPVLLIVIGLLSFASRSGSMEGHVQPAWLPSDSSQGYNNPSQPGSGTSPTNPGTGGQP